MNYAHDSKIAEIITQSITDEITDSERDALNEWIARSPENAALYEKIVTGESLRAYRTIGSRVDRQKAQRRMAAKIRRRSIGRIAAVAGAAAAAVIAAAIVLFRPAGESSPNDSSVMQKGLFVEENRQAILSWGGTSVTLDEGEQESGWKKYVEQADTQDAPAGQTGELIRISALMGGCFNVVLDDGTVAWLNSGSSLEYPRTFDKNQRKVILRGEGYFEVAKNQKRPFVVEIQKGLAVRVLGTKFNVSAYGNLDYTTVTLVDGAVELLSLEKVMKLDPDQQALFNHSTKEVTKRDVTDAMAHAAWIHGVFDFKAEPLNEIMDALAQWYGVNITYDEAMDVAALGHFSMKVGRSEDFYIILKRLGKVTGFKYKVQGKSVHISH